MGGAREKGNSLLIVHTWPGNNRTEIRDSRVTDLSR